MKLEEQVCTLEQAKRLQELGIKDPSLFKWIDFSFDGDGTDFRPVFSPIAFKKCYHAYTVAELGEILPHEPNRFDLNITKGWDGWYVDYNYHTTTGDFKRMCPSFPIWNEHNEAQARAAMLIYLLENGILSPPKTQADAEQQL